MSTIKAGKIQPPGDSDPLQIFTNTVERITVTSGGLVGVGTVTPTATLQALNSVGNAARFGVSNHNSLTIGGRGGGPYCGIGYNINFDSGNDNQYFALSGIDRTSLIRFHDGGFEFKGNATNGAISGTPFALTEYMTILNSGNVGIGTASPSGKLQIDGGGGEAIALLVNTSSTADISLRVYEDNDTPHWMKFRPSNHSSLRQKGFLFSDNGDGVVLAVDTKQYRVGVGTAVPAVALDVVGEVRASTSTTTASAATTLTTKDYVDGGINGTRIGTIIVFSGIIRNAAYNRFGITHTANTATFTLPTGTWNGFVIKGADTTHVTSLVDATGTITISAYDTANEFLAGVITRTA